MASTSKQAFTAGPAFATGKISTVDGYDFWCAEVRPVTRKYRGDIAYVQSATSIGGISNDEAKANTELIAEAFTVAHETGLTPRQLAERCKELGAVLSALIDLVDELGGDALGEEEDSRLGVARSVIAPKGGAA